MEEQPKLQPEIVTKEPLRVVVTAAHHDDIEFGTAGTIAKWIAEGASVTYIIITDGGSGSNDPDVKREDLVALRRKEQRNAAKAVGVTDIRYLDYPDGMLQPTLELRRDITRIIREVKPHRVIAQDPTTVFARDTYINHPDHRAAGEATIYAVFPSSETRPIFPELLEEGYEPHKVRELWMNLTMNPTHFVDISGVIDKKIDSLRAHVSQLGEGEAFDNGALKWILHWNKEAGENLDAEYAEVFKVMILQQVNEDQAEENSEEQLEHAQVLE